METRDELKEMLVNNAASWKKEEGEDDMADIYVDDFLNELLSKFELLPIPIVVPSTLLECDHVVMLKGNYKAKDGTIKRCLVRKTDGVFIAPKSDLY